MVALPVEVPVTVLPEILTWLPPEIALNPLPVTLLSNDHVEPPFVELYSAADAVVVRGDAEEYQ
jgi:hypothetical protein